MRNGLPTILLALYMLVGEIHTFWETSDPTPPRHNWIWKKPSPMTLQWNVKYASMQLQTILLFVAMLTYAKTPNNKVNITTLKTFILFSILDTIMYFWNFKTFYYGRVYLWIAAIWLVIYFWKGKQATKLWKTIATFGR